uniref:Uncharacterized protein n=1 Tax=Angiostrongylus cantonensis TaxID=6313 RepID=A0A0K0DP37_ANGCA
MLGVAGGGGRPSAGQKRAVRSMAGRFRVSSVDVATRGDPVVAAATAPSLSPVVGLSIPQNGQTPGEQLLRLHQHSSCFSAIKTRF